MVQWKDFKNDLKEISENKMITRMLFIHWTLKLNGLACIGVGDMNEKNWDITDVEVARGLVTKPSKTVMYRDPANRNEHYLLGAYKKDCGTKLLVVLESLTYRESVCSLFNLHCHGQRDHQTDKLLRALQTHVGEMMLDTQNDESPAAMEPLKGSYLAVMPGQSSALKSSKLNRKAEDKEEDCKEPDCQESENVAGGKD